MRAAVVTAVSRVVYGHGRHLRANGGPEQTTGEQTTGKQATGEPATGKNAGETTRTRTDTHGEPSPVGEHTAIELLPIA